MDKSSDCYDKPIWTLGALARTLVPLMGHIRRTLPTLHGRPISARLREAIMLAVAYENRCWYCQTAHGVFGRAVGLSEAEIKALSQGRDEALGQDEALALAYARDLAKRGFVTRDEGMRDDLGGVYSPEQVEAIESSAHTMNFFNRFGNTFDAAVITLVGKDDCSGAGALDKAVISALFLPVAALAAPLVGAVALMLRRPSSSGPCGG